MTTNKQSLQTGFREYVLTHSRKPHSVYELCQFLNLEEQIYYPHYSSLRALERDLWAGFFETAKTTMESEPVYQEYSAREKFLSFFYTLQELLKANRSFISLAFQTKSLRLPLLGTNDNHLRVFKQKYVAWAKGLVQEGIQNQEIKRRVIISAQYNKLLWPVAYQIIQFWINDDSKDFERTDAFIEKIAHFSFDLMGVTPVDSALDLLRFVVSK